MFNLKYRRIASKLLGLRDLHVVDINVTVSIPKFNTFGKLHTCYVKPHNNIDNHKYVIFKPY